MEAPPGFEPGMEVLQTSALPLGDGAVRTAARTVRGKIEWSGKRDSNPRLRPWQGRTLPLSYSRPRSNANTQRYHRDRSGFKTDPARTSPVPAPATPARRPAGARGSTTRPTGATGSRPGPPAQRLVAPAGRGRGSTSRPAGAKGVPDQRHVCRPRTAALDGDDVEAARPRRPPDPHHVPLRHRDDLPLLARGHRRERAAETGRGPRLDLNEHEDVSVPRDDVEFAMAGAETPGKNCVPVPAKLAAGQLFARPSEAVLMRSRHARYRDARRGPRRRAPRAAGNDARWSDARRRTHGRPDLEDGVRRRATTAVRRPRQMAREGGKRRRRVTAAARHNSERRRRPGAPACAGATCASSGCRPACPPARCRARRARRGCGRPSRSRAAAALRAARR